MFNFVVVEVFQVRLFCLGGSILLIHFLKVHVHRYLINVFDVRIKSLNNIFYFFGQSINSGKLR